jgi:hypothetical protein
MENKLFESSFLLKSNIPGLSISGLDKKSTILLTNEVINLMGEIIMLLFNKHKNIRPKPLKGYWFGLHVWIVLVEERECDF